MKQDTLQYTNVHRHCPLVTTDIIIEYQSGIVLIERGNYPYGVALPGGFAEYGLTLEQNAVKEAKEETGLEVILESPEHPLCVHSGAERDPRGHAISATYIAQGFGVLHRGDDAKRAFLATIPELRSMLDTGRFAFIDHERAIKEYLTVRGYDRA